MLAAATVVLVAVSGCGGSSSGHRAAPPSATPTHSEAPSPAAVPVTKVALAAVARPLPTNAVTIALHGVSSGSGGVNELAAGFGGVWAADGILRIDPATNTASRPYADPNASTDSIGVGAGSVWSVDSFHGNLLGFSSSGKLLHTYPLPDGLPEDVQANADGVWISMHHAGGVLHLEPASGGAQKLVSFAPAGSSGPQGMVLIGHDLWVDSPNIPGIVRIDTRTSKVVETVQFPSDGDPCGGLGVTANDVWVTQCEDGPDVYRIDRSTHKLAAIYDVGGLANGIVAVGTSAWFVAGGDPDASPDAPSYLVEMRRTGQVSHAYRLPRGFTTGGIVHAFGSLWLSSVHSTKVIRVPLPAGG